MVKTTQNRIYKPPECCMTFSVFPTAEVPVAASKSSDTRLDSRNRDNVASGPELRGSLWKGYGLDKGMLGRLAKAVA